VIWKATVDKQQAEEHVAVLKQRIYTKRLPASFNLLDRSIDNTEKLLAQAVLDRDKRSTLADRRQKAIAHFKYELMTIQIATAEELVRSHATVIANTKDTLASGQVPLSKSLIALFNAIAARQRNIMQRAQLVTKHKLSFFEDAPTVVDEAGTAGATQ
jgi:hypothetical protein